MLINIIFMLLNLSVSHAQIDQVQKIELQCLCKTSPDQDLTVTTDNSILTPKQPIVSPLNPNQSYTLIIGTTHNPSEKEVSECFDNAKESYQKSCPEAYNDVYEACQDLTRDDSPRSFLNGIVVSCYEPVFITN